MVAGIGWYTWSFMKPHKKKSQGFMAGDKKNPCPVNRTTNPLHCLVDISGNI